jgi:hypothetical protein
MSDDPRPEVSPETVLPAPQAGIGKRRLLIKAALVGSTVPVVMTLSGPAYAIHCSAQYGGKEHTKGTLLGAAGTNACVT